MVRHMEPVEMHMKYGTGGTEITFRRRFITLQFVPFFTDFCAMF